MLFVKDNPDSNYFGQIEYALAQISMAYDLIEIQEDTDLDNETLNQYDLVFVFGNGSTVIPALSYDTENNPN